MRKIQSRKTARFSSTRYSPVHAREPLIPPNGASLQAIFSKSVITVPNLLKSDRTKMYHENPNLQSEFSWLIIAVTDRNMLNA